MGMHVLQWKQALPAEVPDSKVYEVLEHGRELLRRLSGGARDIQFRHKVTDQEATIGGPLGQRITVTYIELWARFSGSELMLPPETQVLLRQHRALANNRELAEAVAKAQAERRKELEKQAKDAQAQAVDPVRDDPNVDRAPAHTVSVDKMLVSDEELARAAAMPAGVSVFDGPMCPG